MARANPDLFKKSVERAGIIKQDPVFAAMEPKFRQDVETIVLGILAANRSFVQKEMERLGVATGEVTEDATPDQDAQVREMQKVANQLGRAKEARERLRRIVIGYDQVEMGVIDSPNIHTSPVHYDPESQKADFGPHLDEGDKPWAEVDAQYRPLEAIWVDFQRRSPVMVALAEGSADPSAVAGMETKDARAAVGKLLLGLIARIDEAVPKVGDDLEYSDFVPIHAQLFGGSLKGVSGVDWQQPVEQAVMKDFVGDAGTADLLRTLGLSVLAAAAFILAEFATGGLATFLLAGAGVTLGAVNAGISWDKYNDLATAKQASINPDMALVSKEQVDSALLTAIIDTAFVFLDGAGALAGGGRAARAAKGLVEAGEKGIEASGYLVLKEAGAGGKGTVERAVADLGARETVSRSGKTAEQLIEIVGKDSEAATKLRALSELGEAGAKKVAEDAAAGLAKLGELVAKGDKTEIQRVVLTAYDQFGYVGTIKRAGGWKNLTAAIGKESSTAGDLVMRWRDGLLKDLQDFIAKETAEGGQVVRTGTATNVTNDMDMSMFGEMAAQNGEKAKQFLAGRAGIGVDELDHVLNAEIFVDPSRMHLQDVAKGLAADTRAALSEEGSAVRGADGLRPPAVRGNRRGGQGGGAQGGRGARHHAVGGVPAAVARGDRHQAQADRRLDQGARADHRRGREEGPGRQDRQEPG